MFFTMKRVGNLNKIDTTLKVANRAYCHSVCSPLEPDVCFIRDNCPLRFEGDPERAVCEAAVIGNQQWWCEGVKVDPLENRAQAICSGAARTCTEDGATCSEIGPR